MTEILLTLIKFSVSGSVLILGLMLLKPTIRHKLSKSWHYYIWLIVIARLLLPLSLNVSLLGPVYMNMDRVVYSILPKQSPLEGSWENSQTDGSDYTNESIFTSGQAESDGDSISESYNTASSENQAETLFEKAKEVFPSVLSYLWLIWLVVALTLLIRKITIYQSFVRYIKASRTEVSDIERLELFGEIIEELKIKQTVGLYFNGLISSPLLIGFFRPSIILPEMNQSQADFRNTMLHELTHFKRRDMFYKWLVQLTICVHWFNPLVHFMGREINRLCELSCDEAAVKRFHSDELKSYGDTLLNALAVSNYREPIASLYLNEGRAFIKERLDGIMNFAHKSLYSKTTAILLTVVMVCGFSMTGVYGAKGAVTSGKPQAVVGSSVSESINIQFDIQMAAVGFEYSSGDVTAITADFNESDYEVNITKDKNNWNVSVHGLNKHNTPKPAIIRLPEFERANIFLDVITSSVNMPIKRGDLNVNASMSSVLLDLVQGFSGSVNVITDTGSLVINSADKFADSVVSVINDGEKVLGFPMGLVTVPSKFSGNGSNGYSYSHGTKVNRIDVALMGYGTVNLSENLSLTSLPANNKTGIGDWGKSDSLVSSENTGLTLVKKEFTMDEIKAMGVSGFVVDVVSEGINITTGGDKLIVEYYERSASDYTLTAQNDGGNTRKNLVLSRTGPYAKNQSTGDIAVTIPENASFKVIKAETVSGGIKMDNCVTSLLYAASVSGSLNITGGSADRSLIAETVSGNIRIDGTVVTEKNAYISTVSGKVNFEPKK